MLRQSGQIYHIQLSPNALPLGRDRHTYTSIMNGTQAGQTLPQKKRGGGLQYNVPLMHRLPSLSLVQLKEILLNEYSYCVMEANTYLSTLNKRDNGRSFAT